MMNANTNTKAFKRVQRYEQTARCYATSAKMQNRKDLSCRDVHKLMAKQCCLKAAMRTATHPGGLGKSMEQTANGLYKLEGTYTFARNGKCRRRDDTSRGQSTCPLPGRRERNSLSSPLTQCLKPTRFYTINGNDPICGLRVRPSSTTAIRREGPWL